MFLGVAYTFSQSNVQVDVEQHLSMGRAYSKDRAYADAKAHFWQAIINDTTGISKSSIASLAYCYLHLQKPDSALIAYEFGLKKYPNNTWLCGAYKDLLSLLDREGKVECNIEKRVLWWHKSQPQNLEDMHTLANPLQRREPGKYLLRYIEKMDKRYPTAKDIWQRFKMTSDAWKEVYSLTLFARIHNPMEYHQLYKTHQFDKNADKHCSLYNVAQFLWREKKHYKAFKFKYPQYMLMDLFRAPFVFVGTLTSVDSLCRSSAWSGPMMKIELSDVQSVHKYYDENLTDKKLIFLSGGVSSSGIVPNSIPTLIPSWIIDPEKDLGDDWPKGCIFGESPRKIRNPNRDFVPGKRYIVFLRAQKDNFPCTRETGYDLLPSLHFTALGNKYFPVEGTQVIDVNGYFGKGETIEFGELESLLNSVLDEIDSWARIEH